MRPSTKLALSLALATASLAPWSGVTPGLGADAETAPTAPAGALGASETAASDFPLEGTPWRLTEFWRRGASRTVGPEIAARVTLMAGTLRGSGGCNRISGEYATVGSDLAFRVTDPRDRTCGEQTMVVELGLLGGLQRAATYELLSSNAHAAAGLVIRDDDGTERLRFRVDDRGALTTWEWRLAAYSSGTEWIPADAAQPAVLAFDAQRANAERGRSDGRVIGSTGCNGVVADYFQHANVISFGALELTDAPCTSAAAAQQAAMVAVLDATALALELPPDRLLLASADSGERLEFVSSSPLEGSTWLLSRLPGNPKPDGDVTLRLVDGLVSGQGPCGSYTGRYQTDGVRLSFSELVGAEVDDCEQAKGERLLLDALRRTVLYDKTTPSLRFIDVFGRNVARFAHPGGP